MNREHTATASGIDLDRIRAAFPALASDTVLLENAGGSQVPGVVADRIRDYMLNEYVQLDAEYERSRRATAMVDATHDFSNVVMNGASCGKVIIGPSSTALCNMLGNCYRAILEPGDEIIVAETGHETNIGPWVRLADEGFTVKFWPVHRDSISCRIEDLEPLLGPRTRIVAFPHVSNLLGEIVDLPRIVEMAHAVGAKVVADGVAYAPHRAVDVQGWGVDWYFFSTYKVYGPHMACLFGRHEALAELTGPNHFFIAADDVPYKFEAGGVNHEGCAAWLAVGDYLSFLTGRDGGSPVSRATVEEAFAMMEACETPPIARLIEYLNDRPDFRIIGPAHAEPSRVGTISFVHDKLSSEEVSRRVTDRNIGIRHGHMYAYRLCQALGLEPEDGVVRLSLVHYNTLEEIERVIGVLEEI